MRPLRRSLCPRCGSEMRAIEGRERMVPDGRWLYHYCPKCLHRVDEFKPRRSKRQ